MRHCVHLCCSYGLKGAVYLKNRESQVVGVAEDGSCSWQGGTLDRQLDRISTTTATGTHTFKVFDHITVSTHCSLSSLEITIFAQPLLAPFITIFISFIIFQHCVAHNLCHKCLLCFRN